MSSESSSRGHQEWKETSIQGFSLLEAKNKMTRKSKLHLEKLKISSNGFLPLRIIFQLVSKLKFLMVETCGCQHTRKPSHVVGQAKENKFICLTTIQLLRTFSKGLELWFGLFKSLSRSPQEWFSSLLDSLRVVQKWTEKFFAVLDSTAVLSKIYIVKVR